MSIKLRSALILLFIPLVTSLVFVISGGTEAYAEFRVPPLTGPVVDEANLLSPRVEERISQALRELHRRGGSQISVLTVPDLEGLEIEQASIKVTDVWKLGEEKSDRGVLLLVARDERRVRIEVGQGNEGVLTDAQSRRIIDQSITPLFRAGDFDSGVLLGVYQISRATDPEIDIASYLEGELRRASSPSPKRSLSFWVMFAFFLLVFLTGGFGGGRRVRRFGHRSGIAYPFGHGGGGWGGGGGGGGGWSGGGGGFSGGGSSGSW